MSTLSSLVPLRRDKKLKRHGNSQAIPIDTQTMEALNIDKDTPYDIFTDSEMLIVSFHRDKKRETELRKSIKAISKKYDSVLKKLAK